MLECYIFASSTYYYRIYYLFYIVYSQKKILFWMKMFFSLFSFLSLLLKSISYKKFYYFMFIKQNCIFLLEILHFLPTQFWYNVDVFFISSCVSLTSEILSQNKISQLLVWPIQIRVLFFSLWKWRRSCR